MARLTFNLIKKGMAFKTNNSITPFDERIFRVERKRRRSTGSHKGFTITMVALASLKDSDTWHGMVELPFTMEQINRLLVLLPEDIGGWHIEGV